MAGGEGTAAAEVDRTLATSPPSTTRLEESSVSAGSFFTVSIVDVSPGSLPRIAAAAAASVDAAEYRSKA